MSSPIQRRLTSTVIQRGRTLWHARLQPVYGNYRPIMKSEYLFTSPQISQALYHGIDRLGNLRGNNRNNYFLELTQLKVKKPFRVVFFQTPKNQQNYGKPKLKGRVIKPFTYSNIHLIKAMCEKSKYGGYRAIWDQDQITLCPNLIQNLTIVRHFYYDTSDPRILNLINRNVIAFTYPRTNISAGKFYRLVNRKRGTNIIKSIKQRLKSIATEKRAMTRLQHSSPEVLKRRRLRESIKFAKKFASSSLKSTSPFKRPPPRIRSL